MKLNKKELKYVFLSIILFGVLGNLLFFLFNMNNNEKKLNILHMNILDGEIREEVKEKVDITNIIGKIKSENLNLEYESQNISEIISLVFKEDDGYKSYIIDVMTGKNLSFLDLIKENKKDLFFTKELELLELKYPKFIVEALNNSNVTKFYYVKDNELIIIYYNYGLENFEDILSLRIDYNEIKEYLNFTPNLNEEYENENGYNFDNNKKSIAITFDDGPSYVYNSKILEVLEQNKAHATFFMVGQMMNSCQKCVLDTYNSGNEIGTHTYEHINIKNSSISKVKESLLKTNNIYQKLTNENIKLIRPPYGTYDKENLQNINNPFILWNLDTEDWRYRNVDKIVNYIMENAHDGAIILMHELYETSYEALKVVLPKLYLAGYQVMSVSELAAIKNIELIPGKVYTHFK